MAPPAIDAVTARLAERPFAELHCVKLGWVNAARLERYRRRRCRSIVGDERPRGDRRRIVHGSAPIGENQSRSAEQDGRERNAAAGVRINPSQDHGAVLSVLAQTGGTVRRSLEFWEHVEDGCDGHVGGLRAR